MAMEFTNPQWLHFAYAANILILVPVCWFMFAEQGTRVVFQDAVGESRGLRLLVASLWLAILVASCGGILFPAVFAPVLLIQIVYKTTWLLLFVLPLVARGQPAPIGVATVFVAIVVAYPVLLLLAR